MGSPVADSKPAALFLLLVVVALTAAGGASAATFLVTNMCPFPVWPAAIPTGGGTQLNPGQTWLFKVPTGTKAGRVWGRTGLRCKLSGKPTATLAEFTLGDGAAADFYDISVVDGFNLPMNFMCDDGSGETPTLTPTPIRCRDLGCPDANHRPGEGKVRTCKADRVNHYHQYFVVFCPNE